MPTFSHMASESKFDGSNFNYNRNDRFQHGRKGTTRLGFLIWTGTNGLEWAAKTKSRLSREELDLIRTPTEEPPTTSTDQVFDQNYSSRDITVKEEEQDDESMDISDENFSKTKSSQILRKSDVTNSQFGKMHSGI
jgi:hypothetical protein